ncbi:Ig-like domain-containing protein [Stenotrophomonas sp. SORGH_AS_0321]|uniref:Ig-like domain-containing protein n=1 Tax=Stenotrophomonas sp. SORGH_AS_0321 TaxID=3041787 RepID=UPI002859C28E|nr:Ig-like domain-containing protein [Stenotrophomonas sp. SORGH_AS_0321]MDR6093288.1 hypothetical protein [Stenotrophomonas sp. SORGH_AS_0321]
MTVNWATSHGDLSAASSSTDADGSAVIMLSGAVAGVAQVTAQVGSQGAVKADAVTLTADGSSGGIGSGDLSVDTTRIVANNVETATYRAVVKDANGNGVANAVVTWSTDHGDLAGTSSTTDADGVATMTLRGVVAGPARVTAAVDSGAAVAAEPVELIADVSTAVLSDISSNKLRITGTGEETATL